MSIGAKVFRHRYPGHGVKTSFEISAMSNMIRMFRAQDASGTIMHDGVERKRDDIYGMGRKHPESAAGWSSLAYQAKERSEEALKIAREAADDAQKYQLIASASAEQARMAQLQGELTSRTISHQEKSPGFKKFCTDLRGKIENAGGAGAEAAALEHLQKDCGTGELVDFCSDLKAHLHSPTGKQRIHDKEMVQMRKFCAGLTAKLDESTGVDAPTYASELAKTGYEQGFTLYDTPPETWTKFPKRIPDSAAKTIQSGYATIGEAKQRCAKMKGCKGFNVTNQGPLGLKIDFKDRWVDPEPGPDGSFLSGESYRYTGILTQAPWPDPSGKFQAPMRHLWQQSSNPADMNAAGVNPADALKAAKGQLFKTLGMASASEAMLTLPPPDFRTLLNERERSQRRQSEGLNFL